MTDFHKDTWLLITEPHEQTDAEIMEKFEHDHNEPAQEIHREHLGFTWVGPVSQERIDKRKRRNRETT